MVKPRNKKELALAVDILKQHNIPVQQVKQQAVDKKKATKAFLDSLPARMQEVQLHMEGKIELPSWDEVKHTL